ncbi:MAG: hypothetical protein HMLKMBBP_03234 [Planctomycetes bacterium]|nr:hypothetical protein [Planctomycetota bacterium]
MVGSVKFPKNLGLATDLAPYDFLPEPLAERQARRRLPMQPLGLHVVTLNGLHHRDRKELVVNDDDSATGLSKRSQSARADADSRM